MKTVLNLKPGLYLEYKKAAGGRLGVVVSVTSTIQLLTNKYGGRHIVRRAEDEAEDKVYKHTFLSLRFTPVPTREI